MNVLYKVAFAVALGTATLCNPVSRGAMAEVVGRSAVGADVEDTWDRHGVVVTRVDPGGPFALAGISPGDIILGIHLRRITDLRSFYAALGTPRPGTDIVVHVHDHLTGGEGVRRIKTW